MSQPVHQAHRDPASEQASIAKVRAGDQAAFHDIYVAYYANLRRFATQFVHTADAAEDVVHAVFARIWHQRARWFVESSLYHYLRGSVRNEALRVLRHEAIIARTESQVVATNGRSPGMAIRSEQADDAVNRAELSAALDTAIAALPERRRLAATLRWGEGLSYADIGRIMQITADAAYMHVSRARDLMRIALRAFKG